MGKVLNGIDVSTYQGDILWDKVKPKIDFAILRCGYGSDIKAQDDSKFERNVSECERLNIPFAVYLYSYATTESMIDSEVCHALRLIGNHKPFRVYIDMEDKSTASLGKERLTAFAKRFCEAVKANGFEVGVYANQNWFQNFLDVKALRAAGYSIWCAKYSTEEPKISAEFDIWQYSSSGAVSGISGRVDMNRMYKDIRNVKPATVPEAAATDSKAETVYTVKSGDTLSGIASKYGTTYQALAKYNGIANPNVIHPGQKIKIPTNSTAKTEPQSVVYTVKSGDTLSGIASKYGTTYQKIAKDNGIANPNLIYAGQKLVIKK